MPFSYTLRFPTGAVVKIKSQTGLSKTQLQELSKKYNPPPSDRPWETAQPPEVQQEQDLPTSPSQLPQPNLAPPALRAPPASSETLPNVQDPREIARDRAMAEMKERSDKENLARVQKPGGYLKAIFPAGSRAMDEARVAQEARDLETKRRMDLGVRSAPPPPAPVAPQDAAAVDMTSQGLPPQRETARIAGGLATDVIGLPGRTITSGAAAAGRQIASGNFGSPPTSEQADQFMADLSHTTGDNIASSMLRDWTLPISVVTGGLATAPKGIIGKALISLAEKSPKISAFLGIVANNAAQSTAGAAGHVLDQAIRNGEITIQDLADAGLEIGVGTLAGTGIEGGVGAVRAGSKGLMRGMYEPIAEIVDAAKGLDPESMSPQVGTTTGAEGGAARQPIRIDLKPSASKFVSGDQEAGRRLASGELALDALPGGTEARLASEQRTAESVENVSKEGGNTFIGKDAQQIQQQMGRTSAELVDALERIQPNLGKEYERRFNRILSQPVLDIGAGKARTKFGASLPNSMDNAVRDAFQYILESSQGDPALYSKITQVARKIAPNILPEGALAQATISPEVAQPLVGKPYVPMETFPGKESARRQAIDPPIHPNVELNEPIATRTVVDIGGKNVAKPNLSPEARAQERGYKPLDQFGRTDVPIRSKNLTDKAAENIGIGRALMNPEDRWDLHKRTIDFIGRGDRPVLLRSIENIVPGVKIFTPASTGIWKGQFGLERNPVTHYVFDRPLTEREYKNVIRLGMWAGSQDAAAYNEILSSILRERGGDLLSVGSKAPIGIVYNFTGGGSRLKLPSHTLLDAFKKASGDVDAFVDNFHGGGFGIDGVLRPSGKIDMTLKDMDKILKDASSRVAGLDITYEPVRLKSEYVEADAGANLWGGEQKTNELRNLMEGGPNGRNTVKNYIESRFGLKNLTLDEVWDLLDLIQHRDGYSRAVPTGIIEELKHTGDLTGKSTRADALDIIRSRNTATATREAQDRSSNRMISGSDNATDVRNAIENIANKNTWSDRVLAITKLGKTRYPKEPSPFQNDDGEMVKFFHGTYKDRQHSWLDPNRGGERASFLTDDPDVAKAYPYGLKKEHKLVRNFSIDVDPRRVVEVQWDEVFDVMGSWYEYGPMQAAIKKAKARGAQVMIVRGMKDVAENAPMKMQSQYVILDPSVVHNWENRGKIRSPHTYNTAFQPGLEGEAPRRGEYQGENRKAIMHKGADVSTAIHEWIGHDLKATRLNATQRAQIAKKLEAITGKNSLDKNGEWTVDAEEAFASQIEGAFYHGQISSAKVGAMRPSALADMADIVQKEMKKVYGDNASLPRMDSEILGVVNPILESAKTISEVKLERGYRGAEPTAKLSTDFMKRASDEFGIVEGRKVGTLSESAIELTHDLAEKMKDLRTVMEMHEFKKRNLTAKLLPMTGKISVGGKEFPMGDSGIEKVLQLAKSHVSEATFDAMRKSLPPDLADKLIADFHIADDSYRAGAQGTKAAQEVLSGNNIAPDNAYAKINTMSEPKIAEMFDRMDEAVSKAPEATKEFVELAKETYRQGFFFATLEKTAGPGYGVMPWPPKMIKYWSDMSPELKKRIFTADQIRLWDNTIRVLRGAGLADAKAMNPSLTAFATARKEGYANVAKSFVDLASNPTKAISSAIVRALFNPTKAIAEYYEKGSVTSLSNVLGFMRGVNATLKRTGKIGGSGARAGAQEVEQDRQLQRDLMED
jgi:hypothetical protein